MRKLLFILWLCLTAHIGRAQFDSIASSFASTITAYDLHENLSFIASPANEGRETGTPGLIRAAEFLASRFGVYGVQQMGAEGSYFQSYKYLRSKAKEVMMYDSLQKFQYLSDYYVQPDVRNGLVYKKQVVFMGYAIECASYNDYTQDTLLRDKIIVVLNDEPFNGKKYLTTGTAERSTWYHNMTEKINHLSKYHPAAVVVVDDNFWGRIKEMKKVLENDLTPSMIQSIYPVEFPVIYTNLSIAAKLLQSDSAKLNKFIKKAVKKGKPAHIFSKNLASIEVDRVPSMPISYNVIGYVEGTDLKNEYIVISAHYDHLGMRKGKIYYGADDDGSGTSALLEISEAFAIAKQAGKGPRRSILFCAFSGEEKGLLGSVHYVKNPRVPLENTVLDLNIDMIGRVDSAHAAEGVKDYVYPIGADRISSETKPLLVSCNDRYTHLKLDYKYNDPADKNKFYSRSDHYNFAKNNIPVIFFFTGVHADYHKPTDTVDKIDFNKMETITRLVFHVAWEAANQTNRLITDLH